VPPIGGAGLDGFAVESGLCEGACSPVYSCIRIMDKKKPMAHRILFLCAGNRLVGGDHIRGFCCLADGFLNFLESTDFNLADAFTADAKLAGKLL